MFNLFTYPASWDDKTTYPASLDDDGTKETSTWADFDPFFEIETCLRKNWFGENKPLQDFSDNFLQLGNNYHYHRVVNKYDSLSCKEWWEFWGKETENPKECNILKITKDMLEDKHIQSKLLWRKLYNSPNLLFSIENWWFNWSFSFFRVGIPIILVLLGWEIHAVFKNKKMD